MTTLGIGRLSQTRKTLLADIVPQDISPEIRAVFFEVLTWCFTEESLKNELRSPEFDPSAVLTRPLFDEIGTRMRVEAKRVSYKEAVSIINEKRRAFLRDKGISVSKMVVEQSRGNLLLYDPLETVVDGAAEAASSGFFDIEDAPPWDTWFQYSNGAILSWVPESLINQAQSGIGANPVDCIRWAKWRDLARGL